MNLGESVGNEILPRVSVGNRNIVGYFLDEFGENLSRNDLGCSIRDDGIDIELKFGAERGGSGGEGGAEESEIGCRLIEISIISEWLCYAVAVAHLVLLRQRCDTRQ